MRYARLLVLGVALGAGLLAARMVMDSGPADVAEDTQAVAPSTLPVLVSTRDIKLGDQIQATDLSWVDWPIEVVPQGAITRESQPDAEQTLVGQIAKAPIYVGEPIREQRLINTERGFMAAILPKGMRAIAVAVEAETTAGGFILPGDKVDVILTKGSEGSSRVSSETILENVRVLAIDTTTAGEQAEKTLQPDRTATLELSPQQAETVSLAQQLGKISLALRSAQDSADSGPEQTTGRGGVSFVKYGVSSQAGAQ
ncbi:Flp pilus assembly protein CpaB [Microvirga tunisiensis]|uniref:Flp pilus assembly protein CpaB n=2 Tax=Pannonibacter tanglangensis TaxID=2750084 RepID=A0A7X5J9Q2_9HYPH|nr:MULTISPECIES: Flp pilus assembly protein CpaB [unclassified Pannonibacter]NBN64662.1 Flp pilus assembly protein CpaB [Pannonibacter sp. XCT-34]NBN79197.1 Flp pilus assembly protein CpaB [Pannonibacter sp. XCT-53]